jgi:hypothetical protein
MFLHRSSMPVHDIEAVHNNSDIQTELVYNVGLLDIWSQDDALYLGFKELAAEQYCWQCDSKLRQWVHSAFHGLEEHNFGGRRYICLTDVEKRCDEIELEAQCALFEWKAVFGRRFLGMDGVLLLLGETRTPNESEFLDLIFQRCRSPLHKMLPRCGNLFDQMHRFLTDVGAKIRRVFVDGEGNVLPGMGLIQLTPDLATRLELPVRHDVLIPIDSPYLNPDSAGCRSSKPVHDDSEIQTALVYNSGLVDIWSKDDALYLGFQELAAEQYCWQCNCNMREWVHSAFNGFEEHNVVGRRYICLSDVEKRCDEIELEAQCALFEWKAVFGRRFLGMDGVRLLLGETRTPNEREFLDREFQRCRSPLREMLPRCGVLFDEMHTILTDVGAKFRRVFVDGEGNVLPGKGLIHLTPDLAAPLGLPVRHDVLIPTNTSRLLDPVHALQDSASTLYHRLVFAGYDFSDETRWKRCYAHYDCGLPRNDINC